MLTRRRFLMAAAAAMGGAGSAAMAGPTQMMVALGATEIDLKGTAGKVTVAPPPRTCNQVYLRGPGGLRVSEMRVLRVDGKEEVARVSA